jgi:hypothetical protein
MTAADRGITLNNDLHALKNGMQKCSQIVIRQAGLALDRSKYRP